jgi:hypothetical protein
VGEENSTLASGEDPTLGKEAMSALGQSSTSDNVGIGTVKIPMSVMETKEEPKKNFLDIICPYCDSEKNVKRGTRRKKMEIVQLYLCQDCKRTFTPGSTKGRHYPLSVILDAISLYYIGFSLEQAARLTSLIVAENKALAENATLEAGQKSTSASGQDSTLGKETMSASGQCSTLGKEAMSASGQSSTSDNVGIGTGNIGIGTLVNWLEKYKPMCAFTRMRPYAVAMFSPKEMISSATLAHRQLYRFRHHRAKTILIIQQDFKHSRFWPLKEFLDLVPSECPHQYFQRPATEVGSSSESQSRRDKDSISDVTRAKTSDNVKNKILRASEVPITFSKTEMIVRSKKNFANKMAKFVLQSVESSRDRHDALQRFMLANDSVTVATEVPIYLRREDLAHMQTQLGFKLYKKPPKADRSKPTQKDPNQKKEELKKEDEPELLSIDDLPHLITGHIDFVQIRNGQVHILDYKPNAAKERPIEQLTIYALALSRLTGLKVFNFKCAWFDEKDYFEFFPLHVVYKPDKRRKRRNIPTKEGLYRLNDDPKKFTEIRPIT